MANVFANIECSSVMGDNINFNIKAFVQFGGMVETDVTLQQSQLNANPSTINNLLVEAIKVLVFDTLGNTVGGGEKVTIFGGAV